MRRQRNNITLCTDAGRRTRVDARCFVGVEANAPTLAVPDSSSRRSTSRQRSLAALLSWPRFVDAQRTPAEIFTVELCNGRFGFALVRHLDEAETARPARLAVHEDLDGRNFTKRTEGIAKLVFAHAIGQIANVDIHHQGSHAVASPDRALQPTA